MNGSLLGILFALTSAAVWGGGDFSGGVATRRSHQFQVLVLSAFSGLVVLLVLALLKGESLPSIQGTVYAMGAGLTGALGLACLYRALSLGHAANVAPTAAVVGAMLPVGFTAFREGLPPLTQVLGFTLALLGIWLVSRTSLHDTEASRQGFILAILAGLGFGGFFILLAQVESGLVYTPLILARSITLLTALLLLLIGHLPLVSPTRNPVALLAGVLDAGGNIFYLLAKEYTRLDIAAVLSSLYPASTVLLAYVLLKERITRYQWVGVIVCLAAIALIVA